VQPTVPGQIASEIHERRSRRHLTGHLKSERSPASATSTCQHNLWLLRFVTQAVDAPCAFTNQPTFPMLRAADVNAVSRQVPPNDELAMHIVAVAGGLWHKRTATKDQAAAEGGGEAEQEATLAFEPITLVCQDLRYFVDAPKGASPFANSTHALCGALVWLCSCSIREIHCCIWALKSTYVQCHRCSRGPA
jgi:hypothetical protein